MGKDNNLLMPWYAVNDDPMEYQPFSARSSGADGKAHAQARRERERLRMNTSVSKDTKRMMAQNRQMRWLIVITKAVRKALRESLPYEDVDSQEWFGRQSEVGLCDVCFVFGEWARGVLQPCDKTGIICWYANGDKRYTTIDVDDDGKAFLIERQLLDVSFEKPQLSDNSESFANVLLRMADVADSCALSDSWGDNFRRAAAEAKDGDLTKAYYLSETGGGMGSWYDTPAMQMEETRRLNQELFAERRHAMMYAANYG